MDTLLTSIFILAIVTLSAVGIFALPWSEAAWSEIGTALARLSNTAGAHQSRTPPRALGGEAESEVAGQQLGEALLA